VQSRKNPHLEFSPQSLLNGGCLMPVHPHGVALGVSAHWLYEWVGIGSDCCTIFHAGTAQVVTYSGANLAP
jgi:hypothetical protein